MNNKIPPIFFDAIDLNNREKIVLDVLLGLQMAQNVSQIARRVKLPRMTTSDILNRLGERKIALRIQSFDKKRAVWMLNRKINQLGVKMVRLGGRSALKS